MAHIKAGGTTRLGRDSRGKRLGLKLASGETAKIGQIILRQRGRKFKPGRYVGIGRDHTLFALKEGIVVFRRKMVNGIGIKLKKATFVEIAPQEDATL